MPFSVTWGALCDACQELSEDATLVTPRTQKRFQITEITQDRITVSFEGDDRPRPLPRDQFEALYDRVSDSRNGFSLDNMPTGTEPYAAVLSLHPRYEVDEQAGVITEHGDATTSLVVDDQQDSEDVERIEPDVDVYSDVLLLIDALKQNDPTALEDVETPALVNLYTLLSDVQREANGLRKDIGDVLLDRLHHDQPVHGQFGSVQRTSRRQRSLKDEDEVLERLEDAGISRDQVLGVDRDKVDEALDVVELRESAVYDIDESEYVRKAEVDEERKESRLQGLKDQLALSDDPETEELQTEVEELEERIEELTEFRSGNAFHTQSRSNS